MWSAECWPADLYFIPGEPSRVYKEPRDTSIDWTLLRLNEAGAGAGHDFLPGFVIITCIGVQEQWPGIYLDVISSIGQIV